MSKWYLSRKGEQMGPYSYQQIEQFVDEGRIKNDDLLWNAELGEWTPFEKLVDVIGPGKKLQEKAAHSSGLQQDLTSQSAAPSTTSTAGPQKKFPAVPLIVVVLLVAVVATAVLLLSGSQEEDELVVPGLPSDAPNESTLLTADYLAGLSTDQKLLFATFGSPDHFVIIFERDPAKDTIKKTETWAYQHLNYFYVFEDGIYLGGRRAAYLNTLPDNFNYTPMHFAADMSIEDVIMLVGSEPETVEETEHFNTYHYENSVLSFTYDQQGRLLSVIRMPEVRDIL